MRKIGAIIILGLLVVPTTALAQKVNMDYDHDADFTTYQTYAWANGTPVPNPLQDQRIVSAIESELSAKGIQKVDSNPDIHVSYHASAVENKSYVTDSFGYGYGRRWGGGMGSSTTREITYVKGTLVVDLWEAKEKQLVWRGTATDTIDDNPEKNSKKVHKAVEKLFEKYPPEK